MRTADDLFGGPQGSPRTDELIAASVQWAREIMLKIDSLCDPAVIESARRADASEETLDITLNLGILWRYQGSPKSRMTMTLASRTYEKLPPRTIKAIEMLGQHHKLKSSRRFPESSRRRSHNALGPRSRFPATSSHPIQYAAISQAPLYPLRCYWPAPTRREAWSHTGQRRPALRSGQRLSPLIRTTSESVFPRTMANCFPSRDQA
jgi:hypothetical protein